MLALGLPTLVVLNMADDLRHRGGDVDLGALARQLGAPVVLAAARRARVSARSRTFWRARGPAAAPLELPVLHDVPKCRAWAGRIGRHASYQPPAPPMWTRRLDAVFLHPVAGPLVFALVVVAVFQTIFTAAAPLMDAVRAAVDASGRMAGRRAAGSRAAFAAGRGRLGRRGLRAGLPAADPAAVPVHRHARGFRLPGARGADRGPHHGARRAAGQVLHSAAFGLRLRGAGDPGHAHHREQARPHRHHPDRALHDVLGAPAGLHADHRRVHPGAAAARRRFWARAAAAMLGLYLLGLLWPPCSRRGC